MYIVGSSATWQGISARAVPYASNRQKSPRTRRPQSRPIASAPSTPSSASPRRAPPPLPLFAAGPPWARVPLGRGSTACGGSAPAIERSSTKHLPHPPPPLPVRSLSTFGGPAARARGHGRSPGLARTGGRGDSSGVYHADTVPGGGGNSHYWYVLDVPPPCVVGARRAAAAPRGHPMQVAGRPPRRHPRHCCRCCRSAPFRCAFDAGWRRG